MKHSMFQTVIIGVFVVLAVGGAIYFANPPEDKSSELAGAAGKVTIWGTYPLTPDLTKFFADFNQRYSKAFSVEYRAFDPRTFDRDIVEGLASGMGPDILLLPDDLILRHSDKILPMSYTPQFGQREFLNTFVQAAEIYLHPNGIVAFPYAIDPMVMYWNRDIFTNASIPEPPKYWDDFKLLAPRLTKTDRAQKVVQSALPLGEFSNVKNAKSILSMLFLQTGSPIVYMSGDRPTVLLTKFADKQKNPAIPMVLQFFMDFSNPRKTVYTWSLSRQNSEDEFLSGNLAVYFDYASNYQRLKLKNPNLNFDVAMVPQFRDPETGTVKRETTVARLHGLAVMKSSKNQTTAFIAIRTLLNPENAERFAQVFDLPPVRRDLLANRPADAVKAVAYDSALRGKTWLDPRPEESDKAFRDMVEAMSSDRMTADNAAEFLNSRLVDLVTPYVPQ